jgi:type II secretory pathway pseudopilin PulG
VDRTTGEDAIPRTREVDRALERGWGARAVSAVIVLAAVAMAAWMLASPDRRRQRAVEALGLGADTAAVLAQLGSPDARCGPEGVYGLHDRFPAEATAEARATAMRRLAQRTRTRWVYGSDASADPDAACRVAPGGTEMGIDHAGRVAWYVAGAGRTTLVLPP